jgi:hypothetical protein
MPTRGKTYPREIRERPVRMVLEHQRDYESQSEAICSVAEKLGPTAETVRKGQVDSIPLVVLDPPLPQAPPWGSAKCTRARWPATGPPSNTTHRWLRPRPRAPGPPPPPPPRSPPARSPPALPTAFSPAALYRTITDRRR